MYTFHWLVARHPHAATYSPEALNFVIDNLLRNALAAVEEVNDRNKEITVIIEMTKDGMHRISISDNGKGLPADYDDKLLNTKVTSTSGGTGFGLVFCQNLMKDSRGILSFERRGIGTTFNVDFRDQELSDE